TTKTVSVTVHNDTVVEDDELFTLTLGAASAGTSIGSSGVATGHVLENDTALTISGDQAKVEGQDGGVVEYTFTVTRTGYLGGTSTINWNVAGYAGYSGYGWNAMNAADFADGVMPSGVLTFLPDETTKTI